MSYITKSRIVPASYALVFENKDLGVEIFHGSPTGRPVSMRFAGKSMKACGHYRYHTEGERTKADAAFVKQIAECARVKAQWAAERKVQNSTPHTLKVGDILISSWGWEQTNVDFYEVIGLRGKFIVQMKRIGAKSVGCQGSSMSDMVVAVPGPREDSPLIEKRVNVSNHVAFESYRHASPWDGKPHYRSWYA